MAQKRLGRSRPETKCLFSLGPDQPRLPDWARTILAQTKLTGGGGNYLPPPFSFLLHAECMQETNEMPPTGEKRKKGTWRGESSAAGRSSSLMTLRWWPVAPGGATAVSNGSSSFTRFAASVSVSLVPSRCQLSQASQLWVFGFWFLKFGGFSLLWSLSLSFCLGFFFLFPSASTSSSFFRPGFLRVTCFYRGRRSLGSEPMRRLVGHWARLPRRSSLDSGGVRGGWSASVFGRWSNGLWASVWSVGEGDMHH